MHTVSKKDLLDQRGKAAAYKNKRATSDPPIDAELRAAFFKKPLQQLPDVNLRLFAVLALIVEGKKTSDALIEALQDQLHRTTIFALLAIATDEGLARFRPVITDSGTKREFGLTAKGRNCLALMAAFLNEYTKAAKK